LLKENSSYKAEFISTAKSCGIEIKVEDIVKDTVEIFDDFFKSILNEVLVQIFSDYVNYKSPVIRTEYTQGARAMRGFVDTLDLYLERNINHTYCHNEDGEIDITDTERILENIESLYQKSLEYDSYDPSHQGLVECVDKEDGTYHVRVRNITHVDKGVDILNWDSGQVSGMPFKLIWQDIADVLISGGYLSDSTTDQIEQKAKLIYSKLIELGYLGAEETVEPYNSQNILAGKNKS